MQIKQKYPEVDYGPLTLFIGEWSGDKGVDVAPDPEGTEENPYYETIVFEEAGALENAEKQPISMIRYLQIVKKKADDEVFHDQTGYWMWDSDSQTVMHSIAIPRGLCLVAGGKVGENYVPNEHVEIDVEAHAEDSDWGIVQSPFLTEQAKTVSFFMSVVVDETTLTYSETTNLKIYGRDFEHTDKNDLIRV